MRTREWELQKDGERIAGPVYASNRAAALARVRVELDCKRLPNGSALVDKGVRKPRQYVPPFTIGRSIQYHHTRESLACMRVQDFEGATAVSIEDITYLVLDGKGKIVCGRPTLQQAKDKIRALEAV